MKNLNKLIAKLHTPTWLFVLLSVVLVLRIPSFFEPYSYGDEMIYLSLGEAVRQGIPLYKDIHDNKPPFLYLIAAVSGSLFWFKAILAIWHLITVYIFWRLTEVFFKKNERAQILATSLFALLTTIPLLEGNIANAEIFMIGPTILALLILFTQKLEFKSLFLSGVLFSASVLFKVPAVFDVPAIIFLWLAMAVKINKKTLKQIFTNTLILAFGVAVPILVSIMWYYLLGAFKEYLTAAFFQNVGYLSSWRPSAVQTPFLARNLPLLTRGVVVLLGLTILYWKKNILSKTFLFSTAWLLFSLFGVTLSERPYPHYLLQAVAPATLLLTLLFTDKTKQQVLSIIPLTLAFLVPVYFKFWYYPTFPYYVRFAKLATGRISKDEYLLSFGEHVPRNYKVGSFIASSTNEEDKIFVWGPDSSVIYALTRRFPPIKFVADYHIKDFSTEAKTAEQLQGNLPQFIVVLPDHDEFPSLYSILRKNYGLSQNIDGAEIWKLLSPGVRAIIY